MKFVTLANSLALSLAIAASAQTPTPAQPQPKVASAAAPKVAATPAPAPNVAPDAVVMTVGDEKITRAQFEALMSALPEQVRAQALGPNKRKFAEQYADMKALSFEARRRHIEQNPEVQQRMALQKDSFLASELYQSFKPEESAVKAYYDQHKSEFDQIKASHILIRFKGSALPAKKDAKELTDEEALAKAKSIREKILAGGNFEAIAKAESDDTGSGQNGGSLGVFSHGQMVPPFEQAAYALPKGQLSEPVKTQFGYHIIRVEDRITKTFDEVRPQIEAKLKADVAKKSVEDIKKGIPVTIDAAYFGGASGTSAPDGKDDDDK
jgi:parvulin-like peptidyl-prolyl isomerase